MNEQEDKKGNKHVKIVTGQLNANQTEVVGIGRSIELCTENDIEGIILRYISISLEEGYFND